jgi:hypothetical protein
MRSTRARLLLVAVSAAVAVVVIARTWATRTRPSLARAPAVTPPTLVDAGSVEKKYPQWDSVANEALPPADELAPGTLRILVVGDSVARFLGNTLRFRQAGAQAFVAQRGVGNCSIHPATDGSSCASDWVTDVTSLRPDVTFIILGGGFLGPRTCQIDWRKSYNERLTLLLRSIKPDAGRIILALVPYPGERWRVWNTIALVRCFNDELANVAKAEGVDTVDLIGHVCPTTDCIQTSNGWPVRNDGLHFDGPGAFETADWTLGELRRIERDGVRR